MRKLFLNCTGFDWDDGNSEKNWILHQVSRNESEQVFFNAPIVVGDDISHSQSDKQWFLLGKTDTNRLLFVVFTVREELIRVISSRDMGKKERRIYHEKS
ncbi:MAG: BrnT family toxin [Bacteroidales bacterium]|nr:BrnT family toxin [Bacteroidales bacterium]